MSSSHAFADRSGRELYEALPAVVCIVTPAGDVPFGNARYRAIFEPAPPGERADPVVHPADAADAGGERLAGVVATHSRVQCRLRVRGGVFRWFRVEARRETAFEACVVVLADIDEEKRNGQYLGVLVEAGKRLTSAADVDRALLAIARLVVPLACDWFVVFWPDADGAFVASLAYHVDDARAIEGTRLLADPSSGDGRLVDVVRRTREPLLVDDVAAGTRERRALDAAAVLMVPILGRDTLWGVLAFAAERPDERRFDDGDVRFARELASRTATALDGVTLVANEQRAARELRFLAEIGEKLADSLDLERRLQLVVQAVVPRFADWATVNLIDDDGRVVTAAIAHKDPALATTAARLCGPYYGNLDDLRGTPSVLSSGRSEHVTGVDETYVRRHIRPDVVEDVLALGSDAAFVVPLVSQGHIYGTLATMRTQRERPFTDGEMWLIEEVARRAAVAIANARLFERQASVADAFQLASLPPALPQTLGLQFSACYAPGSSEAMIGGDWYDAFRLADGRIVLSIGDVSGSGLQAAVVMGSVRQLIRGAAQLESDAGAILDATDRALRAEHPDTYVTAFVGILDPIAMRVAYASAGHPPPLLRHADGRIEPLSGRGLPLGLRDGEASPQNVRDVDDGALLVLYTDGLIESTRDILAGEARLGETLADARTVAASDVARALYDRVIGDAAMDDVAILTVLVRAGLRWRFDCRHADRARAVMTELTRYLDDVCEPSGDPGAAGCVFLELVGNAVRYAPGPIDVALDWDGRAPVLSVLDDGPGFRARRGARPSDPLAESGRGLFLVGALSERFEIVRRGGRGSHARATLRLVRRPGALGRTPPSDGEKR